MGLKGLSETCGDFRFSGDAARGRFGRCPVPLLLCAGSGDQAGSMVLFADGDCCTSDSLCPANPSTTQQNLVNRGCAPGAINEYDSEVFIVHEYEIIVQARTPHAVMRSLCSARKLFGRPSES